MLTLTALFVCRSLFFGTDYGTIASYNPFLGLELKIPRELQPHIPTAKTVLNTKVSFLCLEENDGLHAETFL